MSVKADGQVNVLVLGKGTVGGPLLTQIGSQREALRGRHEVDLQVVGVKDSRTAWFDEEGIDPLAVHEALRRRSDAPDIEPLLERLSRLPVPVLCDCTAADGMERVYETALSRGIHVVTANKKPLTIASADRAALFATARRAQRQLRYETTVGAALPVIETLQNLVRTGDLVTLIEGSLSGTLGYLSNEVTRGVKLSAAIRAARDRGYTEPHPRDDLSGMDVARKALILARELGFSLELSDVDVEPFVAQHLLGESDVDAFLLGLAAYDDEFERRLAGGRAEGRVLRYLATVSRVEGDGAAQARASIRVGPVAAAADHPAARLRGTEAQVAFRTERYSDYPLVVQGAGAGGAVTAAGVLADVLAIARERRGR
jgi:aspartokinase/homoserine dehydrogenase 1